MSVHRARTAFTLIAGALLLVGFARLAFDTPWQLFLLALLPAALASAVIVALDRGAHRPRVLLVGTFLWGAVAAPAGALVLNHAVRVWLGEVTAVGDAARFTSALAAPAIEELAKAAALALLALLWRGELRGPRDGVVFGALIGIGFTMAENLYYFALAALGGGAGGLAESVYLRAALGALLHPTFTATAGAALGWARVRGGVAGLLAAGGGLLLAIVQHVAWNAVGAPWLYSAACGPAEPTCSIAGQVQFWFLTAPAIVLLFIGPGLMALAVARRRG